MHGGSPADHRPDAIHDRIAHAFGVGTVGDVEAVRAALADTYPYNLCVVPAEYSASELQPVEDELRSLFENVAVNVEAWSDRVRVGVQVVDQDTYDLLAPYADKIILDPRIRPADLYLDPLG